VSFVYQESDINDGEGEEGGLYPAPLQRQWQMRAGVEEERRGEEIKDYEVSFDGGGLFAERKERRKSIWRQSVGMGMGIGMARAGVGLGGTEEEEEILYSGSEYEGVGDSEIDIRPVGDRDGGDVERDEMKGRRKSVRMPPPTGVRLDEEEVLYSGSDYDAGEDSDDSILPPRDDNIETGKGKGTGKGEGKGEDRGRGSVLFEMLYAHASQPQFQPQPQSPPYEGDRTLGRAQGKEDEYQTIGVRGEDRCWNWSCWRGRGGE